MEKFFVKIVKIMKIYKEIINKMTNKEQTLTERVKKCSWKEIADRNEKGLGTTFTSRTKDNLYCFDCKGYDVDCRGYME